VIPRSFKNPKAEETQDLMNTEPGSEHYVDFLCLICRLEIVNARDVFKINKNAIWAKEVSNTETESREEYNIHKEAYYQYVRCMSCKNLVGHYYKDSRSDRPYKLFYIKGKNVNSLLIGAEGGDIRSALERHTPGDPENTSPWDRNRSRVTKNFTEQEVYGKEDITDQEVKDMQRKMKTLSFRKELEEQHKNKDEPKEKN